MFEDSLFWAECEEEVEEKGEQDGHKVEVDEEDGITVDAGLV